MRNLMVLGLTLWFQLPLTSGVFFFFFGSLWLGKKKFASALCLFSVGFCFWTNWGGIMVVQGFLMIECSKPLCFVILVKQANFFSLPDNGPWKWGRGWQLKSNKDVVYIYSHKMMVNLWIKNTQLCFRW